MSAFDDIRNIGRKPIVARIGGFRPEENIKSWFGGNFLMKSKEVWPKYKDEEMVSVMQVLVSEIPEGDKIFGDTKMIQVFLNRDELPIDTPAENGYGWLLKEYKSTEDLKVVRAPKGSEVFKKFQIKWELSEKNDYPCWEEAWNYADLDEINSSEELIEKFFDEFEQYDKTKIGGYAAYIQSPCGDEFKHIFQISSSEKTNLVVGDWGNLYIMKSVENDKWYLHWDCY